MAGTTFRQFIPYFEHPRVRITLVAGNSFALLEPRTPNEVLIVRDAWYPSSPAVEVRRYRKIQTPHARLIFLSNTEEIHHARLAHGFASHFVNIGCFIDTEMFRPPPTPAEKSYDAVMNARFTTRSARAAAAVLATSARAVYRRKRGFREIFDVLRGSRLLGGGDREVKRHWLTTEIPSVALLDPSFESNDPSYKRKYSRLPNCRYVNHERLAPAEVARVVAAAHVGLALSSIEGVCRASCEYLACGIPVVSTASLGGRDEWYDETNSMIASSSPRAVARAVAELKASSPDPAAIRRGFLARAETFKKRFRDDVLTPILTKYDVDMSADQVMEAHPFRWWL